jgi:hypothetical protein
MASMLFLVRYTSAPAAAVTLAASAAAPFAAIAATPPNADLIALCAFHAALVNDFRLLRAFVIPALSPLVLADIITFSLTILAIIF